MNFEKITQKDIDRASEEELADVFERENNNDIENKVKYKSEILSAEDLINIIYQGESLPKDKRFLSIEDGGVFRFFSPKIFGRRDLKNYSFPVIKKENLVVGLAVLQKSPYNENVTWVKFVSVDPKYRNDGLGYALVDKIFRYAQDNEIVLQVSSFVQETKDKNSNRKIKHITKKIMEKYPSVIVLNNHGKKIDNL